MLARPQRRRQIEQGLEERDEEVDQELPYIQPASRPMSTLPSTSAVVAKPIKNFDYLSEETGKVDLDSQLHLYRAEPADTKKRSIGLVVRKFANCALLFSQKAGLVLIKSSAFENDQQFDFECSMGNWLAGVFTRAQNAHQLPYKFMCMDRIQQTHGPLETRVVGQFVQVLLPNISFNEDTVSKCAIDPTRLKVQTVVGDVSVEASLYTKNELHNSTRSFWVVFTQQQHECFWKLKWPTIIEQTTEQLSEEDHEVCVALSNSCSKSNQAVRGTRHYSFEDDEETGYYDCPSRLPELADQPTPTISETQYSVTPSPPACPSPDLLSFEPVAAPVYQKEEPQTKSQTASLQPVERQISKLKNPKYVSLAELALDELAELGKKQKSAENVQEEETIPKRVVSEAGESADKRTSSIPMTYLKQWHEEQSRVKDSTATDLDAKCIGGSGKNGKSEFEAKKSTTTQSTNSDSFMEVDSHGSLSMQYIASSSNPSPNSDKLTNKSTKQFSSSSASSSAQEDKPAGEYDLVNDPAITCHTDDSWPSDYSGCFSSTGGVYKHNVVDPMHEEGLQDFIGRYAGEDADKIIQYASSSNCSSPEVQEHDDEPALGNGFGAHTPSTGSHESDHELDEQMAGEDNIRLINFDEEVESVASVGTTPHVSEQLFGEDIFSSKASCLDLMADSTKFFETLMAANRHGRTSPKLHNEQGKLKGGNTDIYVHNPNDTELWLNTVFVTSVVVLLAYFYWTLIDFFNSFSSESFQHTPRT
uniref:Uncharacterized protein n=1 Tax=Ditylenchus dipsaci TaxID=166011 RepID=A0A915DRQ6_9BILA